MLLWCRCVVSTPSNRDHVFAFFTKYIIVEIRFSCRIEVPVLGWFGVTFKTFNKFRRTF